MGYCHLPLNLYKLVSLRPCHRLTGQLSHLLMLLVFLFQSSQGSRRVRQSLNSKWADGPLYPTAEKMMLSPETPVGTLYL